MYGGVLSILIYFEVATGIRFRSVVVITLASHARGPGFEPQRNHFIFSYFFFSSLYPFILPMNVRIWKKMERTMDKVVFYLIAPKCFRIVRLNRDAARTICICNNDYGVNIGQVTSSRLCRRCTNLRILPGISGVSRNKQNESKISILGSRKSKKVTKILHSHQWNLYQFYQNKIL